MTTVEHQVHPEIPERNADLLEPADNWKLKSHIGSISSVKFNRDGDLFFSTCRNVTDNTFVWRVSTGEKIGKYNNTNGAILCLDVDAESKNIATGNGSGVGNIWDVETGKLVYSANTVVATRALLFMGTGNEILMASDNIMGEQPKIRRYDIRTKEIIGEYVTQTVPTAINITIDGKIIYSDELGNIVLMENRTFTPIVEEKVHQKKITSLSPSFCGTYFVSASHDFTSKILNVSNGSVSTVREFLSDSPINTAKVTPDNKAVFCAGGTLARHVTTTKGKGNFHVEAFDCVTSKMVGYYSMHFGTVNVLDIHPSGQALLSGGEDGIINLIRLDDAYYINAPFTPLTDVSEE
ncbi:translation initiation factor 3 subunit I [Nematocida sp. LUAm3]|nr:translation initiation factor 3 subunit I [Nematocida sp. LUAm3]KAI5174886.1 translation initiation factor 3 subunit I [Nematocida sp. LUAm2]KAI5177516.1 translation initiation factor 3 subunit I [Nematocida sp. LUAm1]